MASTGLSVPRSLDIDQGSWFRVQSSRNCLRIWMKVVGCHRAQGLIYRVGVQDVEYIQVVGSGFGKLTPGFLPLFATARSSSVSGRHLAFGVWSYGRRIRQKKETFVTTNTGGDRDRSQMHGGHWASPPKRRVRVFGVGVMGLRVRFSSCFSLLFWSFLGSV